MFKGSITVYLSLVFTLVLGLICTVVESGRVSAIKTKTESVTYMALDSKFSEYARPLFEEYGLMFLWSDQGDFVKGLSEYAEYNCNLKKGILSSGVDFNGVSLSEIEIQSIAMATDDGGAVFANEVSRYMKYAMVENILESILAEINIFDQGGKVREFYDKIADFSDKLTKVEETVREIKDKIDSIQSAFESPEILLDELIEKAEATYAKILEGNSYSEELLQYQSVFEELKATKDVLMPELLEIQAGTEEYYADTVDATKAVKSLGEDIETYQEELDLETYNLLNTEVTDISTKATNNDEDFYGVKANDEKATEIIALLWKVEAYYNSGSKYLTGDNIIESLDSLKNLHSQFSGFSLDSLGVNFDNSQIQKDEDSIIDYINKIVDDGILGYVTEDSSTLSEVWVDQTPLPSQTIVSEENAVGETNDKIIYSEYLLNHFGSYLNQKEDSKLKYELEYILSGKSTDKENLASAAEKLMLLREVSNFIYLLKDSEKRSEAYEMAMTLVGFTGMPILVTVTQFLILGAWALAESIVDVKTLMSGKEVSILKSNSEWNLSLFGAKNLSGNLGEGKQAKAGALNYEEYLRILLLMENRTSQYYRTMDVIQINICENYNSSFRMADCISSVKIKAEFLAKPLFTSFPFVKKLVSNSTNSYNLNVIKSYAY